MSKYYQFFFWVNETWTAPIIHEIMIDYLQEKIFFGTWNQTSVDKKRYTTWNAFSLGGQVNNVFAPLQQWFGWHLLESIWNIGPVTAYPWHQLTPVSPTAPVVDRLNFADPESGQKLRKYRSDDIRR